MSEGFPFNIIEVPEGALPPDTIIMGDFTEFERAKREKREVNWNAFVALRFGDAGTQDK